MCDREPCSALALTIVYILQNVHVVMKKANWFGYQLCLRVHKMFVGDASVCLCAYDSLC